MAGNGPVWGGNGFARALVRLEHHPHTWRESAVLLRMLGAVYRRELSRPNGGVERGHLEHENHERRAKGNLPSLETDRKDTGCVNCFVSERTVFLFSFLFSPSFLSYVVSRMAFSK